jgi:hypothetical protein
VRDSHQRSDSYFYAWSEPASAGRVAARRGCRPAHPGYGGERDIQRGPFAQVTWGPSRLAVTGSNPGSRSRFSSVRSVRHSEQRCRAE